MEFLNSLLISIWYVESLLYFSVCSQMHASRLNILTIKPSTVIELQTKRPICCSCNHYVVKQLILSKGEKMSHGRRQNQKEKMTFHCSLLIWYLRSLLLCSLLNYI